MARLDTMNIAPSGDVVFICTEQDQTSVRMRVSSAIVSNASPVFQALLGPHFKEGTILSATSSVEVALPEDNPAAMALIFKIMHGRNNSLPQTMVIQSLQGLVTAADKYDCVESVGGVASAWIWRYTFANKDKDLATLLCMSVTLRETDLFHAVSLRLLKTSRGRIMSPDGEIVGIFACLDGQRNLIVASILEFVQGEVAKTCDLRWGYCHTNPKGCRMDDAYGKTYISYLRTIGVWPLKITTSIEDLTVAIAKPDPNSFQTEVKNICKGHHISGGDLISGSRAMLAKIETELNSFCRPCAQCGAVFTGRTCPHTAADKPFASNQGI